MFTVAERTYHTTQRASTTLGVRWIVQDTEGRQVSLFRSHASACRVAALLTWYWYEAQHGVRLPALH